MELASKLLNTNGAIPELHIVFGSTPQNKGPESEMILDRNAMGRLRRELLWTLGEERMHGLFARLGLSCGQSDFIHNKRDPEFLNNLGDLKKIQSKSKKSEFIFEANDSCEALEHLRFFQNPIKNSQCWLLSGYLTGAISHQLGEPIYFLEVQCVARGEGCCRFIGRSRDAWGPDNEIRLNVYNEDNMALELQDTREQLKQTRDRYQTLFEQSSLPIFIIDPDTGVFIDANLATEELTGFKHEEILKMNIFDFRPQEEHHQAVDYLKALVSGEKIKNHEMTLVQKNGNKRTISQSSKVLSYGGQRVVQTIMNDVTKLKLAQQKEKELHEQLLRSERLSGIGRLAAGVAHELKNPLGAIRNAIYYIKGSLVNSTIMNDDPQLKNIMNLMESEIDGSVRIIGELLDFSRVVTLMPRHTQINELLEHVSSLVHVPDNIKLEMDLDLTLPQAEVDPDRLKQVFSNIASNAIQAMPGGGTLKIQSRYEVRALGDSEKKDEKVSITFEDTGKGIDPNHLTKIFEPLFTTKAQGTGLGLAISRNIIEKHSGEFLVTSRVGKGTTLIVKLPMRQTKESEEDNVN